MNVDDDNGENSNLGLKSLSRRSFLKSSLKVILGSIGIGGLVYLGLNGVADNVINTVDVAEKKIRELTLDISALPGFLEHSIGKETEKLKAEYYNGKLGFLVEMDIMSVGEREDLEKTIERVERIQDHYNLDERLRIFRDRMIRHSLEIDNFGESLMPDFLQGINDGIRSFTGKLYGEDARIVKKQYTIFIDDICELYDVNEDNRIAQLKILKKINHDIDSTEIKESNKRVLRLLKNEYEMGNISDKVDFKTFVDYYPEDALYSDKVHELFETRRTLDNLINLNSAISENKKYLKDLQIELEKGIQLKKKIRNMVPEVFAEYESEVNIEISRLRSAIDKYIIILEKKGYDIQTREKYVEDGIIGKSVGNKMKHVVHFGSAIAGLYTFGTMAYSEYKRNSFEKKVLESVSVDVESRISAIEEERDSWKQRYEKITDKDKGDD